MRFLRIRAVQKVIRDPTQLSGRGFLRTCYMKLILSQFYRFGTHLLCPSCHMLTQICSEILKVRNLNFRILKFQIFEISKIFWSTSDSLDTTGVSKIYKIVTKTISYKRYGKILFQKVAQGHELPFVQPGS